MNKWRLPRMPCPLTILSSSSVLSIYKPSTLLISVTCPLRCPSWTQGSTRTPHQHRQTIENLFVSFKIVVDEPAGEQSPKCIQPHQLPPFVHFDFSFSVDPYQHLGRVVRLKTCPWVLDGDGYTREGPMQPLLVRLVEAL